MSKRRSNFGNVQPKVAKASKPESLVPPSNTRSSVQREKHSRVTTRKGKRAAEKDVDTTLKVSKRSKTTNSSGSSLPKPDKPPMEPRRSDRTRKTPRYFADVVVDEGAIKKTGRRKRRVDGTYKDRPMQHTSPAPSPKIPKQPRRPPRGDHPEASFRPRKDSPEPSPAWKKRKKPREKDARRVVMAIVRRKAPLVAMQYHGEGSRRRSRVRKVDNSTDQGITESIERDIPLTEEDNARPEKRVNKAKKVTSEWCIVC